MNLRLHLQQWHFAKSNSDLFILGAIFQLSEPPQRLHLAHADAAAVPAAGRGIPDERLLAVAQAKVHAVHGTVRHDAGKVYEEAKDHQKGGTYRLRYTGSWLPLAVGVRSRNLVPMFLTIPELFVQN